MKKFSILLFNLLLLLNFSNAQNYKRVFYKPQTIENNDIKIIIEDAVSSASGIKFKVSIFNKTNDYIIYKPSESVFKIGGKDYNPNEKMLVIRPNDEDYKVVDLKGSGYMIAQNFNFLIEGLYKFSTEVKGINTSDFKLPAGQNNIKAGGFDLTLQKSKKTTAKTDATFIAKYVGEKIGVFEPNKVTMKMSDGKEYANYLSNRKPIVFAKGMEEDFTVAWKDIPSSSGDMQKQDMMIIWHDAFKEITPDKLVPLTLTVMFDEEQTKLKNK
jgi:hypothetical protein